MILNVITFFLGAVVLYWAHILGSLLRRIRFWDFQGPRNDMFEWLVMDCNK